MAADNPLSIMEEKLGMVVYEARWESMSDLMPETFEEKEAWALVTTEAIPEVILDTSERMPEAMLLATEPGLARAEVAAATLE